MTRYPVTPHPFQSPTSFYNVGIGEEKLKLRPEWAHIKERDMALKLPLSISKEKNSGDYDVRDADGEMLMLDTSYYPVAPIYEQAVEIVNAVNSRASLVEEVERLRSACSALLTHWDRNDGREKRGEYAGVEYWSPAGRMVDTDFIVGIREALEKTNA